MHNIPLAERIRPIKLSEFIGQHHLIGKNGTLEIAIKNNHPNKNTIQRDFQEYYRQFLTL